MNSSFFRTCNSCGAQNRVPTRHLASAGQCGSCHSPLPPSSEPLAVNSAQFDEIVRSAPVPVLVDFWASWCGPCRAAAPEVSAVAKDMAGQALVLKVDTEAQPELAGRFRVQSIPNFMVFLRGEPVFQQAGAVPRGAMKEWLESTAQASASR